MSKETEALLLEMCEATLEIVARGMEQMIEENPYLNPDELVAFVRLSPKMPPSRSRADGEAARDAEAREDRLQGLRDCRDDRSRIRSAPRRRPDDALARQEQDQSRPRHARGRRDLAPRDHARGLVHLAHPRRREGRDRGDIAEPRPVDSMARQSRCLRVDRLPSPPRDVR